MKDISNEFELIIKYLSRAGARVRDIVYFAESFTFVDAGVQEIGQMQGFIPQHQFFFGNISIDDTLGGVVVLTNENLHTFFFTTLLYNDIEVESARVSMAIGAGLALQGNGEYLGCKRIYGVGCNRVTAGEFGVGAATLVATISMNGYMFTII